MNRSYVVLLASLMQAPPLRAAPSDYVFLPSVSYGEREFDFKAGSEIYGKYDRLQGEGLRFDAWEWENKFQVTEAGEYPVDLGFIVELERPQDRSEGYEMRVGPLFQTEFARLQLNLNLLVERHFQAASQPDTEFGYQWQAKYRWQPRLEYGLQGFGEVAKWNRWGSADTQTHRLGPAVFGKFAMGDRQAIRYNAAWLFGVSAGAPGHTFRIQVEYEF